MMSPDPNPQSAETNAQPGGGPPPLPASKPAAGSVPPPLAADSLPPLPLPSAHPPGAERRLIATLLSLCLGLFLTDGVVSLLDDSFILLLGSHLFTGLRELVFFVSILMALLVYGLMGLTPMIPKRLFLPVTLFNPLAALLFIPVFIYAYDRVQQLSWVLSFCQLLFGLGLLYCFRGGLRWGWPLVGGDQLEGRRFSWRNLSGFLLVNLLVLLPGLVAYLFLCAALAVNHFSAGFLALRPGGLSVQVREYVREDGKTVQLVPMAHVGEPDFYQQLAQSFPTNSVILMEGVTDNSNLITNQVNYERMATSLGLSEQQKEFEPTRGELVMADVDVEQFGTNTIGFLNLIMLMHSRGMTPETVSQLMQASPPPEMLEQIFEDLLRKRNRHLLKELQARLPQAEYFVVPWGAAHMPGIAEEIQKSGFRLHKSWEYQVIRFRSGGAGSKSVGKSGKA